jgi:hypothetical protein
MLRAPPLRRALFIAVFTLAAIASFGARAGAEPTTDVSPASGEPPSIAELLSPEGLREYESGRLLYESGDFAGAYLKFLSAYELSHAGGERDPRLLWNAAACERALRHYANAIVLVRRYLESRSPLITEQAAENARAFITAASAMTVALTIEANVPGAVAYVDDVFVGPVPLPGDTRLDLGTHRIFVRKAGHTGYFETVTTSGQAVHLKALLRPIQHRGRLVVHAGKGDAIFVDGVLRGHGRFEGELPSGPHGVRVTAAGRKPFEREVMLAEDQTRSMDVTLEHAVESGGVPVWAYVAAGVVLSAGAVTGAYFALRSGDDGSADLPSGSMGRVDLPLR